MNVYFRVNITGNSEKIGVFILKVGKNVSRSLFWCYFNGGKEVLGYEIKRGEWVEEKRMKIIVYRWCDCLYYKLRRVYWKRK